MGKGGKGGNKGGQAEEVSCFFFFFCSDGSFLMFISRKKLLLVVKAVIRKLVGKQKARKEAKKVLCKSQVAFCYSFVFFYRISGGKK